MQGSLRTRRGHLPARTHLVGAAALHPPVQVGQAARFVLVSFVQLGTNNDCNKNRYRGSIRELTFG